MSRVKLFRIPTENESGPIILYEGTLVNEAGEPIEAPKVGTSVFLRDVGSRKKKVPWTFRTSPIVEISLYDPGTWEVWTNDGHSYSINADRVYH